MKLALMTGLILVLLPLAALALNVAISGLNVGDLPDHLLTLQRERQRLGELTRKIEHLKPRLDAELEMMNSLYARQMTLAEAVKRMCQLRTKDELAFLVALLRTDGIQGASTEEVLCRHLLRIVDLMESSPQKEVVSGLKAEMGAYLREGESLFLEKRSVAD
jgi:hypothetical protein